MTPQQIRAFQLERTNHLGLPLKVDGDLGPQTRWAMDLETVSPRRQLIVWRALCCAGIDEPHDDNRHPVVDLMLRRCKQSVGQPWCAALASDCLGTVAQGGAMALLESFPETTHPMPGDLGAFRTGPWQGHIGIVLGMTLSEAMLLEGNSRNQCRVVRRARHLLDFARTVDAIHGTCPGIPPKVPWEETRASTEGTR